jgi:hypothetical protein
MCDRSNSILNRAVVVSLLWDTFSLLSVARGSSKNALAGTTRIGERARPVMIDKIIELYQEWSGHVCYVIAEQNIYR